MSEEVKANILLVDDDPRKRLGLTGVLNTLGHNLFVAESGADALRLALQREYAVILLDVQMPDMDGFEAARLLRGRPQSARTPIIFITAYEGAEIEMLRGYALGAVDYIFAPVVPEILTAKVNAFLDMAVTRQRLEAEIAERKRATAEIAELNASLKQRALQLEAANHELESFAYSVSHDLRAPLRAIRGFSAILQEDYAERLDDEGRRVLQVVLDNGQTMTDLIEALLVLSRSNVKQLSTAQIDMTAVARAAFDEIRAGDGASDPELHLGPLPSACADAALIRQVWTNLLSNAVKYSAGRERPVIEVNGYIDTDQQVYCVRDNGAGFDMRYYDKLFGVFQRLHDPQQYPGTGVGLAIVQRVVSRHGGRVWAEGRIDEGATFFFSLPLTATAGPEQGMAHAE